MMTRIFTVVHRYVLIHLRNPARLLDLFFWPAMELLVWGFFTLYLRQESLDPAGKLMVVLINGVIFWDILYRSQQAMSLAFMEELWTRNVLNLLISPLRISEWVAGASLYGLMKTTIIVFLMLILAVTLYAFKASVLGFYFIPLAIQIVVFGYAMGLFTTGLLLRWGHAAEALIWGVPFIIQPFSAFFYPLSVYPAWLQPVCLIFPSTWVLEGMRGLANQGAFPWTNFAAASALNVLYIILCGLFCTAMLNRGRENGQIVRMAG